MKKTFNVVAVLLVFAVVLVGLGALVWQVADWFLSLPGSTMTAIASVVGVLSVPVITYFTTRSLEQRRSRENAMRARKTEFYDGMIRDLMSMFGFGGEAKKTQEEMAIIFGNVMAPLLTFGSRGVILAWNKFRTYSSDNQGDTRGIMLAFEGLIKAMRKDLGHGVLTHQNGELLGVFVNDVADYFKPKKGKVTE